MLAVMDATLQGVFFLVAVILFAIAAFVPVARVNLIALGLAFFAVPFMYNAFDAA
jgi:hypothetical protein